MIKSWFVSLFIIILLVFAVKIHLFDWLASGSAKIIGFSMAFMMLIVARIVLNVHSKK